MIAEYEAGGDAYRAYGLRQSHKHIPEMKYHSSLSNAPVFTPAVGNYAQGMIVEVPLPLWSLPSGANRQDLADALHARYTEQGFVDVHTIDAADQISGLDPEACNGTNKIDLFVFGSHEQARLIARFDNLGKGASGAAVQNLNLVLGKDEAAGLS
ncbi:MAG: hypothetical protein AAGK23_12845 [Pseudomonadota bacterium]